MMCLLKLKYGRGAAKCEHSINPPFLVRPRLPHFNFPYSNCRSFFKRRKGGRSSSRDPGGSGTGSGSGSKELASYSDVASLSYADNLQYQEENPPVNSYVRVERLDCK